MVNDRYVGPRRLVLALFLASLATAARPVAPDEPEAIRPLRPGDRAPAFTVREPGGGERRVEPGHLVRPTVIVFYRGGWCPYCNLHLAGLRATEPRLRALGYEVLFLSADRPEVLLPSLKERPPYTLLSDARMEAARGFGVSYRSPGRWRRPASS